MLLDGGVWFLFKESQEDVMEISGFDDKVNVSFGVVIRREEFGCEWGV
jgi:hypothetical protein